MSNILSYIYVYIHVHSSVDGHLGCFHVLAIVNSAAVNIGVHVSFQISVFILFRYIPRSGIGKIYFLFNFLFFYKFIYFWLCLGLCCYTWAFSSYGEQRLLFIAVRELLIAVASLVEEHGL